jgi:hypothetical protein
MLLTLSDKVPTSGFFSLFTVPHNLFGVHVLSLAGMIFLTGIQLLFDTPNLLYRKCCGGGAMAGRWPAQA